MKTEAVEAEETDNSTESSPETTETDTPSSEGIKPTEDKETPFHENPKIRDFVERQAEKKAEQKMAQLREEYQRELAKMRDEINPKKTGQVDEKIQRLADRFFQGDVELAKEFHEEVLVSERKMTRQEILDEMRQNERRVEEATAYMHSEIEAIKTDKELNPEGIEVDRNRLYKIVEKFNLKDPKDETKWNWRGAWEIYKNQLPKTAKTVDLSEKKKIAAASSSTDRSVDKPAPFKTHEDFLHGRPF